MSKSVVEQAAITEHDFMADVKSSLDQIHDSKEPTVVVRENGKEVVIFSREELESWKETLHILSSPKTAERLRQSLKQTDENSIKFNSVEDVKKEFGL